MTKATAGLSAALACGALLPFSTLGATPCEALPTLSFPDTTITAVVVPAGTCNIVNDWIRHKANFDGVIDFDRVIRSDADPDLMNPILDLGDHIHPNPFGYFRMGQAVDLKLFEKHIPLK